MGLKSLWNRVVNSVGGLNEDDEFETDEEFEDEEDLDEVQPARRHIAAPRRSSLGSSQADRPLKMMIVEPETFDDSQNASLSLSILKIRRPMCPNGWLILSAEQRMRLTAIFKKWGRTFSFACPAMCPLITVNVNTVILRHNWLGKQRLMNPNNLGLKVIVA